MNRTLYIAAYDIRSPQRLRRALYVLKGHASGRQKSVFEVYLSDAEKRVLMDEIGEIIHPEEDRFFLLKLSGHQPILNYGIAIQPLDQDYFCIN